MGFQFLAGVALRTDDSPKLSPKPLRPYRNGTETAMSCQGNVCEKLHVKHDVKNHFKTIGYETELCMLNLGNYENLALKVFIWREDSGPKPVNAIPFARNDCCATCRTCCSVTASISTIISSSVV